MHKPIIFYTDISGIEEAFDFFCPVCGKPWSPGNKKRYCEHVALDFTPECAFIAKRFLNTHYEEHPFEFLDDILTNGCEEQLFIYEIHSEGIACGPMSETNHFGFSLKEWSDLGVAFE
jgi:hypothetical protein